MIVTFSGLDGVGKTTQINLLLNDFSQRGLKVCSICDISADFRYSNETQLLQLRKHFIYADVVHTRFRMNSDINNGIMQYLEHGPIPNPKLAQRAATQGYLDFEQWHNTVMCDVVGRAKVILYDRCHYDEIAFKTLYGCDFDDMVSMYRLFPKADLSIYLSASPRVLINRNSHREDGKITLYRNVNHISQLNSIFDRVVAIMNITEINGEQSIQSIHRQIMQLM